MEQKEMTSVGTETAEGRRGFLATATSVAMGSGLVVSYGTLGTMAGRFLYTSGPADVGWQLVCDVKQLHGQASMEYTTPSGASVVVARQGGGTESEDFIALSSICPHLGCQVHWEPQNERFFCPCHNGAFDARGKATQGPPAKARQRLLQFPLKVEDGLLFIEAPLRPLR